MDPLISYYGGKTNLAPFIARQIPHGFDCYVEPFCGSAAVFFAAPGRWANSEVLNDINGDLMNLFRVLQDDGQRRELLARLDLTPFAREMWQEAHKVIKQAVRPELSPVYRAWAYLVAHEQSFNKAAHSFRVPIRNKDQPNEWHNNIEYMVSRPVIARLKQATLENKSFEKLIPALDSPQTIFYIDPPYIGASDQASVKVAYSGFMLSKEQDALLVEMVKSIRGGVILSGYPRDDLPDDWQRISIDVAVHSRYIPGESRKKRAVETIWISPRAQTARLL